MSAVVVTLQERHQSGKCPPAVADEAYLDGVADTNTCRIEFDLHRARLSWFRKELDIGERGADHQQCVAVFHRLLRRKRTEQPDLSRGIRTIVWHRRLSQERLHDRRSQNLGDLQQFIGGPERASSRKN